MSQIARILDKLRAKGILLPDPAPRQLVESFEARHQVSLPQEYRDYLMHVANGGPGPPAYGILPIGESARDMRGDEKRFWTQLEKVNDPFPFTRHWIWENEEVSDEGTDADVPCGSVVIGNDGCGMYWHLIVTGPDRGIPWMISGEGVQPVCPKRTFLDWYEDWLDGRDSFYGFYSDDGAK